MARIATPPPLEPVVKISPADYTRKIILEDEAGIHIEPHRRGAYTSSTDIGLRRAKFRRRGADRGVSRGMLLFVGALGVYIIY